MDGLKHNNLLEKRGNGFLDKAKEFVKKHKKKIAAVSGAVLGTAALGTHLYHKYKKPQQHGSRRSRLLLEQPPPLEDIPRPQPPLVENIPRLVASDVEHKRDRRDSRLIEPVYDENIIGLGKKKNSLLKQVQAYKKQHGCTLKEAWAAVKSKHGNGVLDKAKEFVKKHKKKIAAVSGAVLGTTALGTAAALGHKYHKKRRVDRLIETYLDPNNPYFSENVPEERHPLHSSALDIFRQAPQPTELEFPEDENVFRPRSENKGDGIKDFLKKHKKKIAAAALGTSALGIAAALGYKKYKRNQDFTSSINPSDEFDTAPNISSSDWEDRAIESERNPLYFLDENKGAGIIDKAKEFLKKHERKIKSGLIKTGVLSVGPVLGLTGYALHNKVQRYRQNLERDRQNLERERELEREEQRQRAAEMDRRIRERQESGAFEQPNPVYSLIFSQPEERNGNGLLDKAKEFLKKNEKKLKQAAKAAAALGTAAAGAHILHDQYNIQRNLMNDEAQRRNVLYNQYRDQIINNLEEHWARQRIQEAIDRENAQGPGMDGLGSRGGMKMLPNPNNPETGLWEGYEKPLCRCGNTHDVILEKLGGLIHLAKLAKKHHYKIKKGKGLVSNLHSGITKGLNLLGNLSMDALIEIGVGILGERFRKSLTRLIKKYGWKSLNFIKKYAHKGLTFIKKEVEKELEPLGSGLCKSCPKHYEKMYKGGIIKQQDLHKMYGGVSAEISNWFVKGMHSLGDIIKTIIPGPIGAIAGYIPSKSGKIAELLSPNYHYKDPLEEKGSGMCGGEEESRLEKLIDLIPFDILGSLVRDKVSHTLGNPNTIFSMFEKRKGRGKKGGENKLSIGKQLMNLFPYEILKEIVREFVNMPEYAIIPENRRLHWNRVGGSDEPEMKILPTDENKEEQEMAHILPYYGDGNSKNDYYKLQDPNYNTIIPLEVKNNNSDYKQYNYGMKNPLNGGKNKKSKKKLTKKMIKKILSKKIGGKSKSKKLKKKTLKFKL